jgi:DNA-binding response OmpR family regulator
MKKILLVEDDSFLIDIYKTKFKEAGFELEVAKDGQTALKMLKKIKPDLLLLDIVLPQISGWEILGEIRENSSFKNLKVIILSNLGQKEEVEKGLKLGADKYLIKAYYTPAEIVQEVKELLKEKVRGEKYG